MRKTMLAESNPVAAVSIVLALAGAVYFWMRVSKWLCTNMAGWNRLVEKFPAPEIDRPGDTFKNQTGWIGNTEYERSFTLQLIPEGLLVRPDFAKRNPILIPWFKIKEVAVREFSFLGVRQNLNLTVEWEKRLHLSLPAGALPVLERYVPSERLRRTGSLMDALRERRENTQGGFELPRRVLSIKDLNKVLDNAGLICFARRDAKQANQTLGSGGSRSVGSPRRAAD